MRRRLSIAIALLFAAIQVFAEETIRVEVHNVVGLSERFNVVFVVEGESAPSDFQWAPGDDFQLVWGPQKGSSTSVQIINGKVSKSSQTTYTYILLPEKTGSFSLPAAVAKIKGREIVSRRAQVEVVADGSSQPRQQQAAPDRQEGSSSSQASSQSEDIFMRFNLSRSKAVLGEPVNATLKLYKRANIVGFENARFPSFNGFWSQETESPSNIEFKREQVGDKIYDVAVLRRWVLIPQKAGSLTIDPAEIVCLVNVKNSSPRAGRSIFDAFFEDDYVTVRKRVVTSPVTVTVSQLPAGAPDTFKGGVGDFTVSASLSRDSLKAHDAASLVVTLSGKGNISMLEAPKINFPPDFEVYDVKTTQKTDKSGTSGTKTFEYPFIPRSSGDFTLSPVAYSFYNIGSHRYSTVKTDSLRIHVERSAVAAASPGADGGSVLTVDRKGVKNLGEDIRFIKTRNSGFSGERSFLVRSPLYWILAAALLVVAFIVWLSFRKIAARRADVSGTRNRKAAKMALKRLQLAGDFLKKGLYTAFYEELHRALLGFVSDKLAIGQADQTKDRIGEALRERGISDDLAGRFTTLLDECEYARYSPDAGNEAMNVHYQEAVSVITAIASNMKKTSSSGTAAVLAALLMALPLSLGAAPANYPDSLWNAGVEAYAAGEYKVASEAWEGILSAGLSSADLYYNAGNAAFKQGYYGKAILYYERGLKLDPASGDLRYNLEFARAMTQDRIDTVPEFFLKTWIREMRGWMGPDAWAALALALFALSLGMWLLFFLSKGSAARRTGFFTGIVLLLLALCCHGFASGAASGAELRDEAVVMKAVSAVKSSPSADSAKDLFILHEGTKVKLLDQVGAWNNIELADGRQGWIRSDDIEII